MPCASCLRLPGAGDWAAKDPLSHYHLELGLRGRQDKICHRTPWAPRGTDSRSLYICFVSSLSFNLSSFISLAHFDTIISNIFSYSHSFLSCMLSLSFWFSLSHIPPLYSPFQIFYLSICFARPSTPHMKSLHLWINFSSIYVQLSLFHSKVTASRLLTMAVLFSGKRLKTIGAGSRIWGEKVSLFDFSADLQFTGEWVGGKRVSGSQMTTGIYWDPWMLQITLTQAWEHSFNWVTKLL